MNDSVTSLEQLKKHMRSFGDERDWGQFHTPKNLTMALSAEAAELMEIFLWVESDASKDTLEKKREAVEHEVADVFAYLLSLCARYNIDLASAYEKKMLINAEKYPIEKAKGNALKYTEL